MNRVLLVSRTTAPTRDQLVTSERRTGELLFSGFPDLHFAGYMVAQGAGRMAAMWIIPPACLDSFKEFVGGIDPQSHEIQVFEPGTTAHGGQTEVRTL
jgi:glycerol uptake facilitator-like aquaporin